MEILLAGAGLCVVVILMAAFWLDPNAEKNRRKRLIEDGGFDALFRTLRLTPSDDEVGQATGIDGALTVGFDSITMGAMDAKSILRFELDLAGLVPADATMQPAYYGNISEGEWSSDYGRGLVEAMKKHGGASRYFDYDGAEPEILALQGSPLVDHTIALYSIAAASVTQATLADGVFTFECRDPSFVFSDPVHDTLRALLDGFAAMYDSMNARESQAAELVRLLTSRTPDGGHPTPDPYHRIFMLDHTRWEAARTLCAQHADTEEFAELASDLDALEPFVLAACLRWTGTSETFACMSAQLVDALVMLIEHAVFGEEVTDLLIREHAWETLLCPRVPVFVRVDASTHAWDEAAGADVCAQRDARLAELFTSLDQLGALHIETVFENLTASGWAPSPERALKLATDGQLAVRTSLLDLFSRFPDPHPYAPAIAALKRSKTLGADGLFDRLDLDRVGGRLSLTSDEAIQGGLSALGERGGLTGVDD